VAQLASVIGREFDSGLLAEISGLGPDDLDARLRVLVEQAVVEPKQRPDGPLWFRHALIHEAAYRSLLRPDRRAAHGRVADALMQRPMVAGAPQVIAHHLGEAGRYEEAAEMWRQASRLARRNSRFREAAGHERRLLELVPNLPEASRDTVELHARRRLAICLTTVDQSTPEAITEAERALELGTRLGDDVSVLETYLVLVPWWQAQADYSSIREALPRAISLAERVQNKWFSTVLTLFEATMSVWQGRIPDALAGLNRGWSDSGVTIERSLRSFGPVNDLQVLVLCSLRMASALACWLAGDVQQAWKLADDTLEFAADNRTPPAQAVTSATAAILAQLEGDPERTAVLARLAEELPDEIAILQWRRWAAVLRWWAGDRLDAPALPGPMLRPYFQMLLAGTAQLPIEESIALLDQALDTARDSGECFCMAEILRIRARERHRAGDLAAAAADLRTACAVAREQGARSLELRALNDRFNLLGDREVIPPLAEVLEAIGSTGARRDVEIAQRVLAGG
jgi:tetratricopeptide (TPR) repeat protein